MSELPTTPPRQGETPRPSGPTPEDPRQREPIHDPPVDPEHDEVERENPVRQASGKPRGSGERGIEAPDPSPDDVVFDESRKPG
jgi:hypothetical protein